MPPAHRGRWRPGTHAKPRGQRAAAAPPPAAAAAEFGRQQGLEVEYEQVADEYAGVVSTYTCKKDQNDWQGLKEPLGLCCTASRDDVKAELLRVAALHFYVAEKELVPPR